MKKHLILGSLLAFASVTHAQNTFPSTGNVGVGTLSPANDLEVKASLADQGISIVQSSSGAAGLHLFNNISGGHHYALFSYGDPTYSGDFGVYDYTAAAFRLHIDGSTGNVGIGTTSPGAKLHVSGTAQFDGNVAINGNCTRTGTDNFTSDRKLKKDIKPLAHALDKLMLLKPSSYTFKTDEFSNMNLPQGEQMGLIAQELESVFPTLVTQIAARDIFDKDGKVTSTVPDYKAVQYISLIPVLIAGVQEQQATINLQAQELAEQKQLIAALQQKVSGTTGISENAVNVGFQMSQNEPNPFTHETVVKYSLPQTVNSAFMAVYDLTGKQLATFPIQQKGDASVTVTSEKLAAGIYIYSIVADGKVVDSKRMIVADK